MIQIIPNNKGKNSIIYENYIYTEKRRNSNIIYWRCRNRPCICIVITPISYTIDTIPTIKSPHSDFCAANKNAVKAAEIVASIKERAKNSYDSAQSIVDMVLRGMDARTVIIAGSTSALKKRIWAARAREHNPTPPSISLINIPLNKQLTHTGDQFYQYGPGIDGYQNDDILMFYDQKSINNLRRNTIWAVDGTFKTAPTMFFQLFTISYIRADFIFPSIYVLLVNKSLATYNRMWNIICSKNPLIVPQTIIMDFEKASMLSIKRAFADVNIQGCFFHLKKNIFKYLCDNGLKNLYSQDISFRNSINRLTALAYLNADEIMPTFFLLIGNSKFHQDAYDTYQYFLSTYIGFGSGLNVSGPIFPINTWIIRDSLLSPVPQTNNAIEGWHNSFKQNMSNINNSIYLFVDKIVNSQDNIRIKLIKLESGEKLPKNRIFETRRSNIQRALFMRGDTSSLEFLEIMISFISLE